MHRQHVGGQDRPIAPDDQGMHNFETILSLSEAGDCERVFFLDGFHILGPAAKSIQYSNGELYGTIFSRSFCVVQCFSHDLLLQ